MSSVPDETAAHLVSVAVAASRLSAFAIGRRCSNHGGNDQDRQCCAAQGLQKKLLGPKNPASLVFALEQFRETGGIGDNQVLLVEGYEPAIAEIIELTVCIFAR